MKSLIIVLSLVFVSKAAFAKKFEGACAVGISNNSEVTNLNFIPNPMIHYGLLASQDIKNFNIQVMATTVTDVNRIGTIPGDRITVVISSHQGPSSYQEISGLSLAAGETARFSLGVGYSSEDYIQCHLRLK